MTEVWRDVDGFEGFYQVSDLGRVRSCARVICAPGGKPRRLPERSMRCSVMARGYIHVSLRKPGEKQVKKLVHRMVATAFLGDPLPDQTDVNHKDVVKANNVCTNLEWCTHQENMTHAWVNGLTPLPGQRVSAP